jgi:small-conductance mechanosensitive channel
LSYGLERINVSVPTSETNRGGSRGWVVQDITLFTTTYAQGATREVATAANGALANTRIINAARSPKASLNFNLKFPINTPYEKLKFFKSVLLQFLKARPREVSTSKLLYQ